MRKKFYFGANNDLTTTLSAHAACTCSIDVNKTWKILNSTLAMRFLWCLIQGGTFTNLGTLF